MTAQYRISDIAKANLIAMAQEGEEGTGKGEKNVSTRYVRLPRYPKSPTRTLIRIQPFLNALSQCEFQDTREDWQQQEDDYCRANNLPLLWYASAGPGRHPREQALRKGKWNITLPQVTITRFLDIAAHYGITSMGRYQTDKTTIQAVLEAIGQGNLTPTNLPPATHKTPVRYHKHLTSLSYMPPLPEHYR